MSSYCKNSNEQRSKEQLNGANFKKENEKNGKKDELASLKGNMRVRELHWIDYVLPDLATTCSLE